MEACFNELSLLPYCKDKDEINQRIKNYIDTVTIATQKGFRKICYATGLNDVLLSKNYTLSDYCTEKPNDAKTILLLATQKRPYIEEGSEAENSFILNDVKLKKEGELLDTYGFAAAHASGTICIGLCPEVFWNNVIYSLIVTTNGNTKEKEGICISIPASFSSKEFAIWEKAHIPVKILPCNILPHKKNIHLRDDHGKDVLEKFAKRIRKEPYVIEIVNSLPFNQYETKLIRRIYSNGLIEIVLTNTDSGYGLIIRTTARNEQEADWIAQDLEKKYKN